MRTRVAAAVALVAVVGAVTSWGLRAHRGGITLTADFARSTGVYEGNPVTVLGVASGRVVRLKPDGAVVHVTIRMNRGVKVPVGVRAALVARSLVTSREVALVPAYTSGPTLPDGAVVDLQHTAVPLEIDQVLASLQQLAQALGPHGANENGALSQFISAASSAVDGQGARAHDTAVALTQALSTVDAHSADLSAVVTNLSALTQTLAQHDSTVRTFEDDLATASADLAADRTQLAQALASLAEALGQVGALVRDHRADLQQDLHTLATTTSTLLAHQRELASAIDQLPTFGQNLAQTVDAQGRVDLRFVNHAGTAEALPFVGTLCQILGVCDLLNSGVPPLPGRAR